MKKLIIATIILSSVLLTPTQISAVSNMEDYHLTEVAPKKDIIEWVLRKFDGHWYKRLWNASKGIWLTDWIRM